MRQARIFHKDHFAGLLIENGVEYRFRYNPAYLSRPDAQAISIEEKVVRRMVDQLHKAFPKWQRVIASSFLSRENQNRYENLIRDRLGRLS